MDQIPFDLPDSLVENPPKIFSDVKYCVEGTLDDKITKILENGGAKKLGYTTISTTHVIVGEGANEVALNEAEEVFDIPLVQPRWVAFCAKQEKLLPLTGFEGQEKKLFSSIKVAASGIRGEDLKILWGLITFNGGRFLRNLTNKCTHLVTNSCDSPVYKTAKENGIKIVCCDWITECVKSNSVISEEKYDPQYIEKPDAVKKSAPPSTQTEPSVTKTNKFLTSRHTIKTTQAPTASSPVRPQSSTILQVQLSGSTPTAGPRPRAARHQTPTQQKAQGANQIRAHRPLLVNSPQSQTLKSSTAAASISKAATQAPLQQTPPSKAVPPAPVTPQKTSQLQRPPAPVTTTASTPAPPTTTVNTPNQPEQSQVPPAQQQETPSPQVSQQPPPTSSVATPVSVSQVQVSQQQQPPPQQSPQIMQQVGLDQQQVQSQQQNHSALHQQLQQGPNHEQIPYQQVPLPQQSTQLQTALSQASQPPTSQPGQIQLVQQQQQTMNQMPTQLQMQQHIPMDPATSQQQFVQQQNQTHYQQNPPMSTAPNQQMQYVHHQTMQNVQHPGMQQQLQPRPPMHLQQQQIMHGQVQMGQQGQSGYQGMQYQHNIHNLQQQQQQVLQAQKSPVPPQSPSMQNMATPQQQHQTMLSQQQHQTMMSQQPQLSMAPQQHPNFIQQNQMHPQQMQPQQQQQQQQQQFTMPSQSKTPPHQVHPQMMNQQQQIMRPPQSPQPGQQQPVHFQILQQQSKNRLQLVMGSPGPQGQQFVQGQPPTSNAQQMPMTSQQQMFRQQQPLQPVGIQAGNRPQGQMFHQPPPRQQPGMMQMQQQGGHPQQMQPGQPGHVTNLQPILSPQQQQQQQQMQPKQFPEVNTGQQVQQQGQYNVVIHPGQQQQQFNQMNPRGQIPLQQRHPGQPHPGQQLHVGQRVGVPVGGPPRPGVHQWTHQQQLEIYRQIQMDPNIKAKWAQMDTQQRQLLVQKLAQRHREDQLRKEMMLRQQQMNQTASMQGQQQGQVPPHSQASPGVSGAPHFQGQQQSQAGMGQQQLNQEGPHMVISHQGSPTMVPQPTASPHQHQPGGPQQVQQQQIHGSQQPQQQILMQNHGMLAQQQQQQQNNQRLVGPQSPSPTQKFTPSSPLQQLPPRSVNNVIPGQPGVQQGQIIRTQHVFTPQVGQQQRLVNVQQVVVQQQQPGAIPQQVVGVVPQSPGAQQPRFPNQIVVQQQPLPGHPSPGGQKATLMQGHGQAPSPGQWLPGSQTPQRISSPTQGSPQFAQRVPGSPDQQASPGQHWNTRQHSPLGAPSTVGPPGTQNSGSAYVQMVNSKTKTALANLLNNRLQGNSTGTDSSVTQATTSSSSTVAAAPSSTSTTLTMCSPTSPSPTPPAFLSQSLQLPLQHPVSQSTSQSLNVISQRTLSNLTNNSKTIHQVNSYPGVIATRPTTQPQPATPLSLPVARTPFYGHEPSFKAPPNGFLVGCMFWAAQRVDPGQSHWSDIVACYGGEVCEEYNSSKVTHVLCKNQKFPEFQQVIREGKRLVTLNWLSDTCIRKVMAPPFYAIHLPVSFTEENLPLKGQAFSMTGFDGEDRERLIKMLKICGADCTLYFSKINKGLVACRAEGEKYFKAREWKTPIVNIQFLNELMLGNQSCLQMIHAPKYQHFALEQPFRFDINIAPHLMAAWKNPVRINNDFLEKLKSLKRPMRIISQEDNMKRMKLEVTECRQISFLQESNGEPMDVDKPNEDTKPDLENKRPPVIMFSGFTDKFVHMATEKVKLLGGRVTVDFKDVTHLVIWESVTWKLYSALSVAKFIVSPGWLKASINAKRFVDEDLYPANVHVFEKYHKVGIFDVLKHQDRHLLFKGMTFYITPGISGIARTGLERVIQSAGGLVDKHQTSIVDVKSRARKSPRKYIIITTLEDFDYFSQAFSSKPSKPLSIFTAMFLYKCIAEQKVDLGPLPAKKGANKVDQSAKQE